MQDDATHDPYDDFSVTEEPMPDGRTIRYYEWPGLPEDEAEGVEEVDDPPSADV
jgi:hypothetical protein